ncbi:phosphoinositide 3-kinase regulatory subunit 6 [Astatotilapia calliptera]|uniref:Phosphoinositide-3-kinase, regulatory subunit 6b n=1 Tax=Astatotilapia calliptera TaxID=8154 RepID=A0A3P8QEK1_ASTCA|nr:phosphoinositide 3-kinase regulatory subunit 6-like [Astatotilapia calliptera]
MVDPTAKEDLSSTWDSSLCDDVQALFKEMKSESCSHKGMLVWNLQRKVEVNPSCSLSIISILVQKLEKTLTTVSKLHEKKTYMSVNPVLHTLYYVVIQSGVTIPKGLYHKAYECLGKLLILPSPYSTVALHTLRSIKMEMTAPGSLYLKRVIAEQNIKSEHFAAREKVFVLADPAVFSVSLEATVKAYLEVSRRLTNTRTMEKSVLFRVLETGLGTTCQSSRLAQALEVLEDHDVRQYFQDVVETVKQSLQHGPGSRADYLKGLKQIYKHILAASEKDVLHDEQGPVYSTTVPLPEMNFLMWTDEEMLWNLLTDFALPSGSNSIKDDKERISRDSGIVKDLKDSDEAEQLPYTAQKTLRERRNALKNSKSAEKLSLMEEKMKEDVTGNLLLLKEERSHTARVVVLGDDSTLGKLTKAYYIIRKKEAKRNMLTKKLDLQLYYIPVSDTEASPSSPDESRLSLASCLERVDPWYSVNVSSLGAAIPTLPELPSVSRKPTELSLYLLDTLCYYLRCGTQPVNLPVYSVKMTLSNSDLASVEELFVSHLEADIPDFRHLKDRQQREPSVRQKKSSVELFGVVLSVNYTKATLSKRDVKGEASMTWRVVITSEPAASASGESYLAARFDSLNPAYNTKIETRNISIRTMEQRTLCVCLDKDPHRIYTNVQKIEISPCLDPGCTIRCRYSIGSEQELPLSKYLDKVMSLPINSFSGVSM